MAPTASPAAELSTVLNLDISRGRQLLWFIAGLGVALAVPWIGTGVFDIHHDLYYAAYFAAVLGFLVLYIRSTQLDTPALLRRNWKWSVTAGLIVAAAVAANVLNDPETSRPAGAYFVFELLWRGLAYGVVDALLLQAFPGAIAYVLLAGKLDGIGRKIAFAVLALPLVLIITAVYHLGYDQFREDGIRQPETGNAILSIPMLLTANPAGSVVAHAALHVTAVTHAYETPTYLPPKATAD